MKINHFFLGYVNYYSYVSTVIELGMKPQMLNLKITASVLRYALIIKNFTLEFDSIKESEKKEVSTPHASQNIESMRWTEAFLNFYQ